MAGDLAPYPTQIVTHRPTEGEAAVLRLRVWPEQADVRWDGTQPWLAMLRLAVMSSDGEIAPSEARHGGFLAAGFPSVVAAMRAGRRLQALATGYAAESKGQLVGVAMIIVPGGCTETAALIGYARRKVRPGQMLLAASRVAAPPEGRRMEDAFFGEFALYELAYRHDDDAARAAEMLSQTRKSGPEVPQVSPATPSSLPAMSALLRYVRSRPRSIAAVLASSLVVVGGVAIARRPAKQAFPAPAPASAPVVVVPPRPAADSAAKTPPAPSPKVDRTKKTLPPATAEVVDTPKRGRGDLTGEQIRQILNRGQSALDRGCYTEAMGYYRRVLNDDPRNGSATGGLEKARVRMRLSGENAQCLR